MCVVCNIPYNCRVWQVLIHYKDFKLFPIYISIAHTHVCMCKKMCKWVKIHYNSFSHTLDDIFPIKFHSNDRKQFRDCLICMSNKCNNNNKSYIVYVTIQNIN